MNKSTKLFCEYISKTVDKNWYKLDTTALLLEYPIKELNRKEFINSISSSTDLCNWLIEHYQEYDYMSTFHIDTNRISSIDCKDIFFIDNIFLTIEYLPTLQVEEINISNYLHPLVLDILSYSKDLYQLSVEELKTIFNFNKIIS